MPVDPAARLVRMILQDMDGETILFHQRPKLPVRARDAWVDVDMGRVSATTVLFELLLAYRVPPAFQEQAISLVVEPMVAMCRPALYACVCGHQGGFHEASYGRCLSCHSCSGFVLRGAA